MSFLDDINAQLQKKNMAGQPIAVPGMEDVLRQAQEIQESASGSPGQTPPAPSEASPYNQVDTNEIVVQGDNNRDRPSLLVNRQGDQIVDHKTAPDTSVKLFNRAEDQALRLSEMAEDQYIVLDEIQEKQTANLQTKLAVTDRILEEQQAATEKLKNISTPLFKARQDTGQNLQAIREENPLIAGIKGIFDLRYNKDFQQEQLGMIDQEIQGVAKEFEYFDQIQNKLLGLSESRYVSAEAVTDLALKHIDQDWAAAGRVYTTMLDDIKLFSEQLQTNSQMTSARILARNEQLDMLSAADASKLLGAARKAGGMIEHNGIELSEGQLVSVVQQKEKEALALQSAQLSVQGQKLSNSAAAMNLSRMAKQVALENMSRATIQQAMANNGVVNGVQYDINDLNAAYQGFQNRDALMVQQNLQGDPMGRVSLRMREFGGFLKQNATALGATGLGSKALESSYKQITTELNAVNKRLEKARAGGYVDKQAEIELQRIDSMQAGLLGQIEKFAQSQSGGSKHVAAALFGHFTGETVSPDVAINAIVDVTVSGSGVIPGRKSPTDVAIANAARQEYQTLRRNNPKASEAQLKAALRERLKDRIPQAVQQTTFPSIMSNVTAIAKQANHPFGAVPQNVYNGAVKAAEGQTFEIVASKFGQPQEVVQAALQNRPVQGLDAATAKAMRRAFEQTQTVQVLKNLDNMAPKMPGGQRPSQLYADFLGSSRFQTAVQNVEYAQGRLSFGSYLANSSGLGGLPATAGNYATLVADANAQILAGNMLTNQTSVDRYVTSPVKRQDVILAAAGMNKAERKALIDAATQVAGPSYLPGGQGRFDLAAPSRGGESYNSALRDAIISHPFEDPNLRKLQAKAAKGYEQAESAASRLVESLRSEDE